MLAELEYYCKRKFPDKIMEITKTYDIESFDSDWARIYCKAKKKNCTCPEPVRHRYAHKKTWIPEEKFCSCGNGKTVEIRLEEVPNGLAIIDMPWFIVPPNRGMGRNQAEYRWFIGDQATIHLLETLMDQIFPSIVKQFTGPFTENGINIQFGLPEIAQKVIELIKTECLYKCAPPSEDVWFERLQNGESEEMWNRLVRNVCPEHKP